MAGYARISVDDELDRDNVSIENQKDIIQDYVQHHFPGSSLTFFEDRDRSGYTFEQREAYQTMRKGLLSHNYDILVVKDFSRFSRRNSRGLVELEDLRDAGVRIISIGDGIDFPNDDDWLKIQFQFLINEMPVTDTSKKVRSVIRRRQADGQWLCAAPYGYIINKRKAFEVVPTEADIVRRIFELYNNEGWGYKRIANHLTDQGIPTPRMSEAMRKEAEGLESRRKGKSAWSQITIQGILDNDFYIGTFRQAKYRRTKINGKDLKNDEHIVIEHHHQPIIDYRTFATTRALRQKRTRTNYRGVRKYDNDYSGFLYCGDCNSPMFSMSRADLKSAYRCSTYHHRGLAGCTSHHIRVDKLDEILKGYVRFVRDRSAVMLEALNAGLAREQEDISEAEQSADRLAELVEELHAELKATKRQRIRDVMKHPDQEELLEETYDEMEAELQKKIEGLNHQIELLSNRRNTIIQVNRAAKTAMDVFEDILNKPKLERNDLELLIERITVYTDHIEVQLKSDIDSLLRCGSLERPDAPSDSKELAIRVVQSAMHRPDKVFRVNVANEGDPLEIYTDRDGEVIFKKYSLMNGLGEFAAQMCETLYKSTGRAVLITDRDTIIALSGLPRKELMEKRISVPLEHIMEGRQIYQRREESAPIPVSELSVEVTVLIAAPILSEGDVMGSVVFAGGSEDAPLGETEFKLAQTIAGFLGRHMES